MMVSILYIYMMMGHGVERDARVLHVKGEHKY